jgi:hypothetical protein
MKRKFSLALAVSLMAIADRLVTADPTRTAVAGSAISQEFSGVAFVVVIVVARRRKHTLA